MDIGTAISKPFSNIKNLVIGIILMLIPLVNILTIPGYLLRIARKTMAKDNSLPGFDNFGELVVDSLKLIVVGIVYAIIVGIVMAILMFIPYVGPLLGFIWYIVAVFIVLSAMMTLAKTGSIGAALGIPSVAKRAANGGFIVSVIVGAIISAIICGIFLLIIVAIFAASLLPVILAGAIPNTATIMGLFGGLGIGLILMLIIEYLIVVFFYSLVAESYPAEAA